MHYYSKREKKKLCRDHDEYMTSECLILDSSQLVYNIKYSGSKKGYLFYLLKSFWLRNKVKTQLYIDTLEDWNKKKQRMEPVH